jgi:NDP-sugar pyrophosphorylase family protein
MIKASDYLLRFPVVFAGLDAFEPWKLTSGMPELISDRIKTLGTGYKVFNGVAIHETAVIESHAVLKGPAIISPNCFIGSHAYIRGGVFLDENVSLGPGCEVKSTIVLSYTTLAHFNFVGDSILGSYVNMEAGAVVANHYNERRDKTISVLIAGTRHRTGVEKFGALIGDHSKIGANAVLSPGTILPKDTGVRRLELIEQNKN